jgi:uncharacterized protein (DUF433 family)
MNVRHLFLYEKRIYLTYSYALEELMNERIEINPNICHGNPIIRNTRVLVSNILADLASGETYQSIIGNYPNVTKEDISAVLDFSSELMQFETIPFESQAV